MESQKESCIPSDQDSDAKGAEAEVSAQGAQDIDGYRMPRPRRSGGWSP